MPVVRILSRADVERAITMKEAIDLMRDGFIALSSGRVEVPVRLNMPMAEHDGRTLFMPVYGPDYGQVGLKVVAVHPGNTARNLPFIHAVVMVIDAGTGAPLAIMDGEYITALRTGAGAGLATDLLSLPEARVLGIIGAGVQARTQLEAVIAVRSIEQVYIFGRSQESAAAFVRDIKVRYPVRATIATDPAALRQCEVICTATTSLTPVFASEHVRPGCHINGIGSYRPDMSEIPPDTVAQAKVVVDQREACLAEAGDLLLPIASGQIAPNHIYAELGAIASGQVKGRTDPSEITFFKSVGNAVQDLVVASRLTALAKAYDLGVEVEL
ncbi:MAG: hypothetical protein OXI38_10350 [Bacteroidota bacterium]|nr:hypothetical protein [Bacteroidota bacterium]